MSTLALASPNKQKELAAVRVPKKKKVSTRETREMHQFRAEFAMLIRKALPKRLQGPMFAHVICTDIESGQHTYSLPTMAAYSAAIAPKYKLPAANIASLKRYNPRLVEMGLVVREDRYGVYDTTGNGIQASRISSLTKVAVEALKALMPEAIATESATYAVTYAATEGAPVSIPTVYAPIEAEASEGSATPASSPADDAGDLSLKIKLLESAIQEMDPDFKFSWVMGGQPTRSKITSWLDGQDFSAEKAEQFAWGLRSSQKTGTAGILSTALGEASTSEYDQWVLDGQLVIQAAEDQAREQDKLDREKREQLARTCYKLEWTGQAWRVSQERYGPHLKSRVVAKVFDTRPAPAEDVIWLTRSEWLRAGDRYHLSSRNDALTVDQVAGIADAAVQAEDSTPAMA
jgi:hypothetical protein